MTARNPVDDLASTIYWLRLIQLVLAIALLALVGQGVVFVIARALGQDVDKNVFYRVLETVVMPFHRLGRLITPKIVSDRHVSLVVLSLLSVGYIWVMLAIASACLDKGVAIAQCVGSR
jgi:hypothetical protein